MAKSKVILLEPLGTDMDLSSLREFGDITVMFDLTGPRCPAVFHTERFMTAVSEWFEEHFDPNKDYFVVAGRATKIAYALLALFQSFHHNYSCNTLIYDGSVRGYVERKI